MKGHMRVLIVDDEAAVREGLRVVVDWRALGFSVCGEGVDGPDGLDKILSLAPELTLLDLKMPLLSGIEVASRAREAGYEGSIVVLSGYSEFEYAQSAIRLGVDAYLLKPIDEEELAEAVQAARRRIEERSRQSAAEAESLRMARRNALCELLQGSRPCDARRALEVLRLPDQPYQIAVIEPGKSGEAFDAYIHAVLERFAKEGLADELAMEGRTVALLHGAEAAARFTRAVNRALVQAAGALVALGRCVATPGGIPVSYREARTVAARAFFYARDELIVSYTDGEERETTGSLGAFGKRLHLCVELGEREEIGRILDQIEQLFRGKHELKREDVIGRLANLFCGIESRIHAEHPGLSKSERGYESADGALRGCERINDVTTWLRSELWSYSDAVGNNSTRDVIQRLRAYIDKHSSDDLALRSLAELFGYNSAYLGRLFRASVGETFTSYLARARIRNAALLLTSTDMKVYEVAGKAGYASLLYFHREFRRLTGKSPAEYRKAEAREGRATISPRRRPG